LVLVFFVVLSSGLSAFLFLPLAFEVDFVLEVLPSTDGNFGGKATFALKLLPEVRNLEESECDTTMSLQNHLSKQINQSISNNQLTVGIWILHL
jgi:hypothetical protein